MSNFTDTYEMTSKMTEDGIDFLFMSEGKRDVVKIIRYSYVMYYQERDVYNLAFGDYYSRSRSFSDNIVTDNGDPYSVYHTVLATIPYFFQTFEDAMLMVRGSDSTQEFQKNCHITCIKKCSFDTCRKAHRRITIYRNYVNKHFNSLNKDYAFLGSSTSFENQLLTEDYVTDKKYLTILLKKRKFII
ncbi:MAG: hypothetical protein J0H74_08865 [Chitinophagaceae bacterium]|nr:hypothetical protein [Chitinophagaceae bacterium]